MRRLQPTRINPAQAVSQRATRCVAFCCLLVAGLLVTAAAPAPVTPQPAPEASKVSEGASDIASGAKQIAEGADKISHGVADSLRKQWLSDGKIQTVVIDVDGVIDDYVRDSIKARLATARGLGAEVVILQIDTYGGLVTSGLDISRMLKQADDLHIVCFVDDKAISAGSMIALACDEIVMEPASTIGNSGVIAAGPGGMQELGETERAKAESPVISDFADSARRNGYSELLAKSFVSFDLAVYAAQNIATGEIDFVDEETFAERTEADDAAWQPLPGVSVPLDADDTLLTLDDVTAETIKLSAGTFDSPTTFAQSRGYMVVSTLSPSAGERLIGFLSGTAVRGVLMTLLFFAAYAAITSPGTGVPEVSAAVLFAILFGVPWLTGFAEWYEVLLVLLGVLLLAVEVFVIPGFGVFGIAGLVSVFMGIALTFVGPIKSPGLPVGFGVDWNNLGRGMLASLAALFASGVMWMLLSKHLTKLPGFRNLVLEEQEPTPQEQAIAAAWPEVGSVGVAVSDLRPGGTARFSITDAAGDTTNADVVSDRGFVTAGTQLAVVEASGNRIVVRPA